MKASFIAIVSALSLTSCTHYYYMPNAQNVPLFKQKEEFKISGSTSLHFSPFTDRRQKTAEFQSAYSVSNRIGVMANFMSASGSGTYEDFFWFAPNQSHWNSGKGFLGEMGCGYFLPLGKDGVFEMYGGYGSGKQTHNYESASKAAYIKFSKIFFQPTFGFATRNADFALTARVSQIYFNSVEYSKSISDGNKAALDQLRTNKIKTMAEPGITVRFGWENFKFQIQAVSAFQSAGRYFHYNSMNFNIGATILISNRYDKKT